MRNTRSVTPRRSLLFQQLLLSLVHKLISYGSSKNQMTRNSKQALKDANENRLKAAIYSVVNTANLKRKLCET
jgi:hypothetical protein